MHPLAWAALTLALAALAWLGRRSLHTGLDLIRSVLAGLVWRRRHPRRALGVRPAADVRTRSTSLPPSTTRPAAAR